MPSSSTSIRTCCSIVGDAQRTSPPRDEKRTALSTRFVITRRSASAVAITSARVSHLRGQLDSPSVDVRARLVEVRLEEGRQLDWLEAEQLLRGAMRRLLSSTLSTSTPMRSTCWRMNPTERARSSGADLVLLQRLRVELDGRQRRLHLVRDVRDELVLLSRVVARAEGERQLEREPADDEREEHDTAPEHAPVRRDARAAGALGELGDLRGREEHVDHPEHQQPHRDHQ